MTKWQTLGYKTRAEWVIASEAGQGDVPCHPAMQWVRDESGRPSYVVRRKPGRPPHIPTPEELHARNRALVPQKHFDNNTGTVISFYSTVDNRFVVRRANTFMGDIPMNNMCEVMEVEWIDGVVDMVPGTRAFTLRWLRTLSEVREYLREIPYIPRDKYVRDEYRHSWPADNVRDSRHHYKMPWRVWYSLPHITPPYHENDPATYQTPLMKRLALSPSEFPTKGYAYSSVYPEKPAVDA